MWNNRSVLITGGGGFVGSWLARTLAGKGARVVVLDRKKALPNLGSAFPKKEVGSVTFISGDIRDEKLLTALFAKYSFETVFHLAAITIVEEALNNPAETLDVNVRGTSVLLEVVRMSSGARVTPCVIVASSDKAYGAQKILPYTESMELEGDEHPYDLSKNCADRISLMYASLYRLTVSVTRCANIFGGGDQNKSRLIPSVIEALMEGRPFQMRSDGTYERDFIYIEDVIRAYLTLAEHMAVKKEYGKAYNFGSDNPQTVMSVIQAIGKLFGGKEVPMVVLNTAKQEIRHQYLDSSRARAELQWKPLFSFDEGLQKTVEWYRSEEKAR